MSMVTTARRRALGVRQARTTNSANLWNFQSPVDEHALTLSGDMRMKLFYYCEGDPTVLHADYGDRGTDIHADGRVAKADAVVTLLDGSIQARVIDYGSPQRTVNIAELGAGCGASLRVLSATDFGRQALRIRNWQAVISAFHRCRGTDMRAASLAIETNITRRAKVTLGDLLGTQGSIHPALVLGAAAHLLHNRIIESDLDANPWSLHTRLWRAARDIGD